MPSVRRYAQLSRDETPIDLIHWLHSSRIAPGINKNFKLNSDGSDQVPEIRVLKTPLWSNGHKVFFICLQIFVILYENLS